MKKLIFGLIGASIIVILFLTGGCKLGNNNSSFTEFAIQIDSIQHPDTVVFGKTLNIKFYGTIGPNDCYSFSRFVGGITGNQINIAAFGKFSNGTVCASVMQYLTGDTLGVNLVTSGTYVIHVMEPAPPDIYDTVYVSHAVTPIN